MKLTYDPRRNIGYLRFHEKTAEVETIQVSDSLNVDIAPDGTIYGIELLNANQQLRAKIFPYTTLFRSDWLKEADMAKRLESAIARVIAEGKVRTYDMGGKDSTRDVAKAIADYATS